MYLWFINTTPDLKVRAVLYASSFSLMEFLWYSTTTELPNGEVQFTPFAKTCRKGFTTFAMFFVNVLYTPIMIDFYFTVVKNNIFRVLLFPINVWIGEIIMGYYLIYIYEKVNPRAWIYHGNDAYFDGNIKLDHKKLWWVLGLIVVLLYGRMVGYSVNVATNLARIISKYW